MATNTHYICFSIIAETDDLTVIKKETMPNQYYSLDNNTQQVLPQRPGRPKHESRERTTKSKSQFYVDDREASAPPPPYEEDYQPEEQKRITMQFMRETNVELSLANDILAGGLLFSILLSSSEKFLPI